MDLKNLVTEYKEVMTERKDLEKAAKDLKEGREAELKAMILQYMVENDMQSVHYPEVGRLVRSSKSHYEIFDKDAFARAMLQSLVEAGEQGRPLSDGFIAQFRPAKDMFESFLQDGHSIDTCGVSLVEAPELALRK